mmetsp:Transcript_18419/g.25944  ORF Transcript_18419/g.25944 Transcript_18419/m.25944 type:complete len:145 (+) Transcript_18419:159-593(+)
MFCHKFLSSSLRIGPLPSRISRASAFKYNECFGGSNRSMSVAILSDKSAIQKFGKINSKSILYFTAKWCPPCNTIAPVYENLSNLHPEIAFGKVDVDDNGEAAANFEIKSIPTFIFFDGEETTSRFMGADTKQLETQIAVLKDL